MDKQENGNQNNQEKGRGFASEEFKDFFNKTKSLMEELLNIFECLTFNKTYENIRNTTNWFFAMSAAVSLWIFGNFDKFIVNDNFILKPLFLFSLVIINISVFSFGLIRVILHMRSYTIDNFFEDIKLYPLKIWLNRDEITEEEIEKKWKSIINRGIPIITAFSNVLNTLVNFIEYTIKIYLFGLLSFVAYFLIFLIFYV